MIYPQQGPIHRILIRHYVIQVQHHTSFLPVADFHSPTADKLAPVTFSNKRSTALMTMTNSLQIIYPLMDERNKKEDINLWLNMRFRINHISEPNPEERIRGAVRRVGSQPSQSCGPIIMPLSLPPLLHRKHFAERQTRVWSACALSLLFTLILQIFHRGMDWEVAAHWERRAEERRPLLWDVSSGVWWWG